MKKKLFVFLAAVVTVTCLFAFAAVATDVEWGDVTYGSSCNIPTVIDTTSRIMVKDSNGEYITYPAYYFIWNQADFTLEFGKATRGGITKSDGTSYTLNDVIAIEIPEGIQTFNWKNEGAYIKNLQNANSLIYVKFPSSFVDPSSDALANCTSLVTADLSDVTMTKLSAGLFYNCVSLVNVILPDTVTSLSSDLNTTGYGVFEGCKSLETVNLPNITYIGRASFKNCKKLDFKIPDKVSAIGDYAFAGSGITSVTVPSSVTKIPAYAYSNTAITSLTIPEHITTIGDYAFSNCASLVTVNPLNSNNLTSMGTYVFSGCTALKAVYFPTYYSTIPQYTFYQCTALEVAYISANVTSIETKSFTDTPWNLVFRYTGNKSQIEALQANSYSGLQSGTGLLYEKDADTGALPQYKRFAFYGYNVCDVFYLSEHSAVDDGDCTTQLECERCEAVMAPSSEIHDNQVIIEYENGFMSAGVKRDGCVKCDVYVTEALPPLFVCLGYSVPEDNGDEIAIGYTVDNKALNEYSAYLTNTGKTLKYGVFAVLAKNLDGGKDVLGENGANGVINAEISGFDFVAFELKITGFKDEYKDVKLAIGAYVEINDGENTEYSYIQEGVPLENAKYCFISYNEIANGSSNEEETQ